MGRRLSLLYLSPHVPVPVSSAARMRTYNWLVHLSRHVDITFVAVAAGASPLTLTLTDLSGISPTFTQMLTRALVLSGGVQVR